jgi:hypothetical protein
MFVVVVVVDGGGERGESDRDSSALSSSSLSWRDLTLPDRVAMMPVSVCFGAAHEKHNRRNRYQ